jgi:hypothetical protein
LISKNYILVLKYIDEAIDDANNVNIISENVDNNDFRKIELPDKPKKQSFNYNLVKVGSARRRTRKNKKKSSVKN